MSDAPALVALDWGTTSFRAYLVASSGRIHDRIERPAGILSVPDRNFARVFAEATEPWHLRHGKLPAVAAGMIGSRQGWVEAPYVPCPAGVADLGRAMKPHALPDGRTLWFVPGVMRSDDTGVPDVMRGEETQIVGMLATEEAEEAAVFVMPGTHSKWILVESRRIAWFATFMTGELFAVLNTHSILGRLMTGDAHDPGAFHRGLRHATTDGGLLRKLFSTRTLGLFDKVPGTGLRSYLSGLLIGTEIEEGLACLAARRGEAAATQITLVGTPELSRLYADALALLGRETRQGDTHAAARGCSRIATAAGLIPPG